uniref:Alpha-conotoxin AnIB n=1 Tax=Conus anemone TaxID=101285 RepID=CA1AB_CONAN|nr:RecName: Full=Alpha-conotoxin AnIB; Contains: RecName: Full=Alpha-conotoxin AnIA [Conus anemone]7N23_A Chain A, Alpha-conotoxin AnIB [Conus anemone]
GGCCSHPACAANNQDYC